MKNCNKLIYIVLVVSLFITNIFFINIYSIINKNYNNSEIINILNEETSECFVINDEICNEHANYTYNLEDKKEINNGIDNIKNKSNISKNELIIILENTKLKDNIDLILECENKYNINALILTSVIINQTGWGECTDNIENDIIYYADLLNKSDCNTITEFKNKGYISDNLFDNKIYRINNILFNNIN